MMKIPKTLFLKNTNLTQSTQQSLSQPPRVALSSLLYYAYGISCLYILCMSVIASQGIIVNLILSRDSQLSASIQV